ncbi:MAG: hypothetical protein H6779_01930 [Candidatus Nomurabacteria bacterium]|nr:hypothetical protein [Candidatus Nomurabacteria bacterium]USN88183.1 MAG: hypothetical protein H6779_01930 [Candidatus Nomurabacteria bacterium]
MDKDKLYATKRLAADNDYYGNVFKRTEKIVSVIFYILSHIEKDERSDFHIKTLSDRAMNVYEESLTTLSFYEYEAKDRVFIFQQTLVSLEGVLRIANAARIITDDVLTMLLTELDLVQRYIKNHYVNKTPLSLQEDGPKTPPVATERSMTMRSASVARPSRVSIPKGDISSDAHMVYSQLVDRATRIKTVLEAKPEATIKDIAEVITDVSEKTIQRELNSLIDKGQVIRQGERRWSKYSVIK